MVRKLSDEKRDAIIEAAVRAIADADVAVPTSRISRMAGIAEGTLFLYFENKTALLNAVFSRLRSEQANATLQNIPERPDGETVKRVWRRYMQWALAHPTRYAALIRLEFSSSINSDTRAESVAPFSPMIGALEQLSHPDLTPMPHLAGRLIVAMAEATINEIQKNPEFENQLLEAGIAAMWRAWACTEEH